MSVALPIFLGFVTSAIGITPPGLINMTAAKVSIQEGRTRAFVFASGAITIIFLQTFLAVFFAKFIDDNPSVVLLLREVGLVIFSILTIYFFFYAKQGKRKEEDTALRSKRSRFFLGMLLSALNFFPIPFYVFVSVTLASYDYFSFESNFIYSFVLGSGLGALFAFYCYIVYFNNMESKSEFLLKNMNYIIGSITGLVSIVTLINILNHYLN
ncbi:LysE family transporter [Flavobacterium tegetincola]|uniref:LysE family transporter n=1 Tax=Flavobacterium tegetincola TaxID=150172 RepID=UPI0003FB965E|nr:LysE family transporter [Flavobacterium tegetincola]